MRALFIAATIALLGTSAQADPSRGLVLASGAPAPAASPTTQPGATAAAPKAPAAPATPDKAQAIIEQLVKHGIIKVPNQPAQPPATATTAAPSPVAAHAPATTTAPAATAPAAPPTTQAAVPSAPAQATQPAQSRIRVENPKGMSRTETRIRNELWKRYRIR